MKIKEFLAQYGAMNVDFVSLRNQTVTYKNDTLGIVIEGTVISNNLELVAMDSISSVYSEIEKDFIYTIN